MSDHDVVNEAVERLEWMERAQDPTPASRLRGLTRRTALSGGAAGLAALALNACGGSSKDTKAAQSGGGIFVPACTGF